MLGITTPGELALGGIVRSTVRTIERKLDKVPTIGTPLGDAARGTDADTGTLLIVSGFGGSRRGLGPLLRSAQRDGIPAVGVEIPGGGLAGVSEGVAALDTAIAAVPEGPIHLAGHSKGGMVIQEWWRTAAPEQRARVESMALLASTPTGQKLSLIAKLQNLMLQPVTGRLTSSIAEAEAGNPVMQRISKLDIAKDVRALSVVSEKDGLIKLPEASWDGANNVVIGGRDAPDHMHTLVDPSAYAALRDNVLETR